MPIVQLVRIYNRLQLRNRLTMSPTTKQWSNIHISLVPWDSRRVCRARTAADFWRPAARLCPGPRRKGRLWRCEGPWWAHPCRCWPDRGGRRSCTWWSRGLNPGPASRRPRSSGRKRLARLLWETAWGTATVFFLRDRYYQNPEEDRVIIYGWRLTEEESF